MTGLGGAHNTTDDLDISVELKSVNGRFLKLSQKLPSSLAPFEFEIEKLCKKHLRRGSISSAIQLRFLDSASLVNIDEDVVRAYQEVFERLGLSQEALPTLPGVVAGRKSKSLDENAWPMIESVYEEALVALVDMRRKEGAQLGELVGKMCGAIAAGRDEIQERAPGVVADYKKRLHERIAALVDDAAVLEPEHLAREVALFVDRSDITEELDRLRVHLEQMAVLLKEGGEVGRRLEFLAQEMHREVNTIGSKANDAEISQSVVTMKVEVEKIKEQVANIE